MSLGLMESLLAVIILKEQMIMRELETRQSMIKVLVTQGPNH
jgi:hypothetical protein